MRLMVHLPNDKDATSFYRGMGPLQDLKSKLLVRNPGGLSLIQATEVNWSTLKACDSVFLQRPFASNHLMIVEMAQSNGKTVWVDYDDNLFEVPRSNRTWKVYSKPEVKSNMIKILMKADVVTVSTHEMKRYFENFRISDKEVVCLNRNIYVVPNAYDYDLFKHYRGEISPKRKKLVCWRGSDTHQKDLMAFTQEMINVAAKNLDWTWNFVGDPFWYTLEAFASVKGLKSNSVLETEALDPIEFFRFLYTTQPALQMVPLWDCPFNRSKSNIGWLEGLHAGSVCLGPDWEEWQRPGCLNYKNAKEFETILDSAMRGEIDFEKIYQEGREFVMENLRLSKVNRIREVILGQLCED